jgi:quinol monooxygenase YgiN
MIKVVAKNKINVDKVEIVLSLYEELVNATREEEGCIAYELFQDVEDPSVLTMIEEWEDKPSLDQHMKTEHFMRIVPMVGKFVEESSLNIYHKVY